MLAASRPPLTGSILFLGVCLMWGGSGKHATQQKPDEVDSVFRALTTNGFGAVNGTHDRIKGVMTLTEPIQSQERKAYAAKVAQVNAGDYAIANEIKVAMPLPTLEQLTEYRRRLCCRRTGLSVGRTSVIKIDVERVRGKLKVQ